MHYTDRTNQLPIFDGSDSSYLKRMRHYYGLYQDNQCGIDNQYVNSDNRRRRTFKEVRDYARGMQPVSKYQEQLNARKLAKNGLKDALKKDWNISWDTVAILPKFRAILIDKFSSVNVSFTTRAIDETASLQRLRKKNKAKLKRQAEFLSMVEGSGFSIEGDIENNDYVESPEDVDFVYSQGGVSIGAEIMMKDAVDLTLYQSSFNSIKPLLIQDVVDRNVYAAEVTEDNGRQVIKYIDPAKLIIRESIYEDFRDADFIGYLAYEKMNDIKKEVNLTKAQERKAMNYNHVSRVGGRTDYANQTTGSFGVEVMTMYFIEADVKKYIVGYHKNGSKQFEEVPLDFSLDKRHNKRKKIESIYTHKLYKCKWICGTDIIYGNEEVDRMVREGEPGSKKLLFPISVCMKHEPSLIERCIAFDDEIQLYNFKIRRILSKLPPAPRIIFYKDKLVDKVKVGTTSYSLMDMIQNYQSDGFMILQTKGAFDYDREDQRQQKPFEYVESGVSEDIGMLVTQMNLSIDKIRQVTGVNEVADGTSSNQDMLKSVMQGLNAATNSAIKPNIEIYVNGFKNTLKYVALSWHDRILKGEEAYLGQLPMSDGVYKSVMLTEELVDRDWNIEITLETGEDRQVLAQELASKRDLLSPDHFFIVYNSIKQGDIRKAERLLIKFVKKAQEREHQKNLEIQQAVAQASSQAAQVSEQAKANTIQIKNQADLKLLAAKSEIEEDRAKRDHQRALDFEEIKSRNDLDKGVQITRENNQNRLQQ